VLSLSYSTSGKPDGPSSLRNSMLEGGCPPGEGETDTYSVYVLNASPCGGDSVVVRAGNRNAKSSDVKGLASR